MKDTLKILSLLEENIERVTENGIYEIERDLLLERLRGLYASVVATEAVAEEDRVLDALMGIGAVLPEGELEPEIEIERIYAEEEEEPETEIEPEPEDVEEEIEEEIAEPEEEVIESPAEEPEIGCVCDSPTADCEPVIEEGCAPEEEDAVEEEEPAVENVEEEIAVEEESVADPVETDEIDHEAVLSLYDDDEEDVVVELETDEVQLTEESEDVVTAKKEFEVVEEPAEEEIVVLDESEPETEDVVEEDPQKVVLGDILLSEQTTVADNLAEQGVVDVATVASSVLTLRETIGVNDKYILMRDLFASNNDYYEQAIEKLDSFDSLDEAMLYIYDNFHWNPNCEGARLLMELLARKLF